MLRKEKKCTPLDCWAVPFLVSRCPWFRNRPWFQNHFFGFRIILGRFWFQNHPVLVAESSLVSESFLSRNMFSPKKHRYISTCSVLMMLIGHLVLSRYWPWWCSALSRWVFPASFGTSAVLEHAQLVMWNDQLNLNNSNDLTLPPDCRWPVREKWA